MPTTEIKIINTKTTASNHLRDLCDLSGKFNTTKYAENTVKKHLSNLNDPRGKFNTTKYAMNAVKKHLSDLSDLSGERLQFLCIKQ